MTVTTVFATAPGGAGSVQCSSTVYATARSGGGSLLATADHLVGQRFSSPNYFCVEGFIIFDTSALDDGETIQGVVLSCDGANNLSTEDFTMVAATSAYDGGAVVTTDFVAGASLSGLTEVATWASSGYDAGYNAFTSTGSAFNSAINTTGNTSIILFSAEMRDNSAPTTDERVLFTDADAAGTTTDPKLDITHDVVTTVPLRTLMGVGV